MLNPRKVMKMKNIEADSICFCVEFYKFVVYSVDILFAMCTIKLENMSCLNIKSPTIIV